MDLDGTLVLGNSFHEFLGGLWRYGGWITRYRLLVIALRRVLIRGRGGRQLMKFRVVRLYLTLTPARALDVVSATVEACLSQVSQPVRELLRTRATAGWKVVLATAAPASYADVLAARFEMDGCLASPQPGRPEDELIGERKAAAVRGWIKEAGLVDVPLLVVTDHIDDLPLLAAADEIALHCPAAERVAIEAELGRSATHGLDPLAPQVPGGLWLWFDDRASGPHDVWETMTILSKHRYALLYVGSGCWQRVQDGSSLSSGVQRTSSPRPPSPRQRIGIQSRRRLVRDRLGVFH